MASNTYIYSDFRNDFLPHPITGDFVLITDVDSIIQSVKNVVKTTAGQRYDSNFGGSAQAYLFENPSIMVEESLRSEIVHAIQNSESRATNINVTVKFLQDSDSYYVTTIFSVVGIKLPILIKQFLQRVR